MCEYIMLFFFEYFCVLVDPPASDWKCSKSIVLYCTYVYFIASSDFVSTLSSATIILSGASSQVTITFPLINDLIFEFNENLFGQLSFAAGGGHPRVSIDPGTAEVIIVDNDGK